MIVRKGGSVYESTKTKALMSAAISAVVLLLPAERVEAALSVSLSGLADGAALDASAVIYVEAKLSGGSADKVEFYQDGKLLRTEYVAPYCHGGDSNGKCNGYSVSGLLRQPHHPGEGVRR